jgi:hypothetical protein
MHEARIRHVLLGVLNMAGFAMLAPFDAGAQTPPVPSVPSPATASPEGTSGGLVALLVIVVAFLVAIALVAKMLDAKRKRENEAVLLQAQISDALLREAQLAALAVVPTARVSFWSGPPTIELTGRVPTEETRRAVLDLARSEASRVCPDAMIEDRITVVPQRNLQAA